MYSDKVLNIFSNPNNAGRVVKPEGIASLYNEDKSYNVEFSLRIENNVITDCKFRAQANPYIIAVCSTITEMAQGKSVEEVYINSENVKAELDDDSDLDVDFCIECFYMALQDYKGKMEKSGTEIKVQTSQKEEEETKKSLSDLFSMLKPQTEVEQSTMGVSNIEAPKEEDDDFINLFDDEDF